MAASSCMDDLESLSSDSSEDDSKEPKVHRAEDGVYDRYSFDIRRDEKLPIHDRKEEIVEAIRSNPVIVLEGDTGCGKTTQVS